MDREREIREIQAKQRGNTRKSQHIRHNDGASTLRVESDATSKNPLDLLEKAMIASEDKRSNISLVDRPYSGQKLMIVSFEGEELKRVAAHTGGKHRSALRQNQVLDNHDLIISGGSSPRLVSDAPCSSPLQMPNRYEGDGSPIVIESRQQVITSKTNMGKSKSR